MTTSSSGMYGNFGQTNYGAAKAGVVGFMNTLCIEGAKYDIRVNALAPAAHTRMTEGLIPEEALKLLTPEFCYGWLARTCSLTRRQTERFYVRERAVMHGRLFMKPTAFTCHPEQQTPENVMAAFSDINNPSGQEEFTQGFEQSKKFVEKAMVGKATKG